MSSIHYKKPSFFASFRTRGKVNPDTNLEWIVCLENRSLGWKKGSMAEKMKKKEKKREQGNNILCTSSLNPLFVVSRAGYVFRAIEWGKKKLDRSWPGGSPMCHRSKWNHRAFFQGDYNEDRVTKEHQAGSSTFSFLLYEYRKRNSYWFFFFFGL